MACWLVARGLAPCGSTDVALLKLKDLRQQKDHDCGSVCVDVVCDYWGVRSKSASKLANHVQGMAPETVESVLRAIGFQVVRGEMSVGMLQGYMKLQMPVLCPVTWGGAGHWVVVNGVGRGKVYAHCPTDGQCSWPLATWNEMWRDSSDAGRPFVSWGIAPHLT